MSGSIRGWCPDLFAPMQSGDGWLVRLKPRLGRLTAGEASGIAAQAADCGNGIIELTSRGNLQIRGLSPSSAERFARFAVQSGLASADPALERIRNIQLPPLAGQAACDLALALEQELGRHPGLAALPGKFSFLVDDAAPFGPGRQHSQIVLSATEGGWQVGSSDRADPACVAAAGAPEAACRLALRWLDRSAPSPHRPPGNRAPDRAPDRAHDPAGVIGWHQASRSFGIGLVFGQMDAATLGRLASLSHHFGDGVLHCTPWRVLILSGVPAAAAEAVTNAVPDLVTVPDDPRRAVSACIGSAGCASGHVDARADALRLLAAGVRVQGLHVSGCAKGCAHPQPAPITLVGRDGRYGLVRDGRAGDTPQSDGLSLSQLARGLVEGADGS